MTVAQKQWLALKFVWFCSLKAQETDQIKLGRQCFRRIVRFYWSERICFPRTFLFLLFFCVHNVFLVMPYFLSLERQKCNALICVCFFFSFMQLKMCKNVAKCRARCLHASICQILTKRNNSHFLIFV